MTAKNFALEQALGFNVNRVAFLMSEEISHRFKAAGYPLSAQDFGILYALSRQERMSQAAITKQMMRDKTTITRRLDGLVKKGFIERTPSTQDRRSIDISLTKQGRESMATLIQLVQDFQQELLEGISATDKRITLDTLKTITNKLTRSTQ